MIFCLFLAFQALQNWCKIASDFQCRFWIHFGWIFGPFWPPFWGLGPILRGKIFNFLWIAFLNRFLLDFGSLWGAFWGARTSLLGLKTGYFPGLRSGAGFSFNLWPRKGCRGWNGIPPMAHSIFTHTFEGFWSKGDPKPCNLQGFGHPWSKTLRFISFGEPLAQKPFNLPGFEASWGLPPPSGPFLFPWPSLWFWSLVGPSGASWALLKLSGALLGPSGASCQAQWS